jgi:hypothetical protein
MTREARRILRDTIVSALVAVVSAAGLGWVLAYALVHGG